MTIPKMVMAAVAIFFPSMVLMAQISAQPVEQSANQPAIVWSSMQEPVPAPAGDTGAAEVPPAQQGAQQNGEHSPENREQPTRQTPGQNPSDQATPVTNPSSDASSIHTINGTVVLEGKSYVLRTTDNVEFQLDDQAKARNFENQAVKVTGTVDSSAHTIHIQKIEPAV